MEFELSENQEACVKQMIGKRQSYPAAVRVIHRVQFMKNRVDRSDLSIEGIAIVLHTEGFDSLGDSEKQGKIQKAQEEDEAAEDEVAQAEHEAELKTIAEEKAALRKDERVVVRT